jgi:UDP-glucuronate decarboxylase
MNNPFFYERHAGVVASVRDSDTRYVIVGPGGWIGRATVEYLADLLGDAAPERMLLLGSCARTLSTHAGIELPVRALADAGKLPQDRPCVLFHYAFLTMDKVGSMSEADYIARNNEIRDQVAAVAKRLPLKGQAVPSSGAIYDLIAPRPGRDPAANLYGRLKYEDEFYFEGLAQALGISYVCPRVFNLSGPYINKPNVYAIASFILDAKAGRDIEIHATHPVFRAYAPVQLLIELQILLLQAGKFERFDFVGDQALEVGELANLISRIYGGAVLRRLNQSSCADIYMGNSQAIRVLCASYGLDFPNMARQLDSTIRYLAT